MIFFTGKIVLLRPLSDRDDQIAYSNWINDQETTLFMGSGRFPAVAQDLRAYLKAYSNSKDGMILGIFSNKTAKHIGNITLHQIDWRNRNAEIGIIIGDKRSRGKGYATEAIMLVADHAFNKLNLHKLYTGMISRNEASKRAFEKVGFHVEGILKEHFYLNGTYLDCYRMGMLRKDITGAQT